MDNSTPGMSELLVRYLDGELTGTEKQSVETALAEDPAVQSVWENLKQTRSTIRYYGLRQQVQKVHAGMMEELAPPVVSINRGRRLFRNALAVAASIVLLAGAFLVYSFFTLSAQKVFSSNYKTYELGTLRDARDIQFSATETAFREKKYNEVIRIHDSDADHSPQGEFLCGIAAMELKDDPKAIKCFREVLEAASKSKQPLLKDESEYYLSLSYIRNGDYDLALPLLDQIRTDPAHKFHQAVGNRMIWKVKMLKWR